MQDDVSTRHRIWILVVCALVVVTAMAWLFLSREQQDEAVHRADVPRIVVLPLANLGSPEDAYFASGMTEELTTRLASVSGLRVISRSSAAQYDRAGKTVAQVGADLGVDYVLQGGVHRYHGGEEGDRVIIAPQLSRVSDGSEMWMEHHEGGIENVFELQSDIAHRVVRTLEIPLTEAEERKLDARHTEDMAAYDAYLRALTVAWSFEQRELEVGEELLQRSVALDPGFAAAHALLSENHSLLFHFRYDRSPQRLAGARAAADRALELDPDLPEGHRAMGHFYYWGHRNYEQAMAEFTLATQGRPGDSLTVASIAIVNRRRGRWQEAIEGLERASEMDPRSNENGLDLASTYGRVRDFTNAARHCERAIELAPDDFYPYVYCARIHRGLKGDTDAARSYLESMPDKDPSQQGFYHAEQAVYERDYDAAIQWLDATNDVISEPIDEEIFSRSLAECHCRVLRGSETAPEACDDAVDHFERARDSSPGDPAIHGALGWAYALSGRKDEAIEAGERAVTLLPIEDDAMAGQTHLERLAKIYARVGEHDLAIQTIEDSLAHPGWLSTGMLRIDPDWDPLRDHPRFQEIVTRSQDDG
jgi:serine/threonine-protein kinase